MRNFLRHLLKEFGFHDIRFCGHSNDGACCASYWTRVWIVQELAFARNARIIYGTRLISWETISACFSWRHLVARDDDEFNYRRIPAAKLAVRFEMLLEEAKYKNKKATNFYWYLLTFRIHASIQGQSMFRPRK